MTRYPVYVISKSRPRCITARSLRRMGVDFKVVIEPVDKESYTEWRDSVLMLPFNDLGQGSIPARNWVWNHAKAEGHTRHWILDDNIEDFNRLNRNTKHPVRCDAPFRAAEDFTDRYKNVWLSGFNYFNFCKATDKVPPYYLNTRIYSCILVSHDIPFRWRGRYNEDTDLSLRVLKAGMCTVLFNAFLCGKVTSMRMRGGNTDHVYADTDNRREFAESLQRQHPDCVRVVWRFNRWHHHVDYRQFKKNRLLRKFAEIPSGNNEYGMRLVAA